MSDPTRQLAIDLPHRPALSRADFLASDCNSAALGWIERWPDWPTPRLLLYGPPGSGKTHLARLWCAERGARLIAGARLVSPEPLPGNGATVPGVSDISTGRIRVPTKFAPACVRAWPAGADNGGATAPGVTRDAIKLVTQRVGFFVGQQRYTEELAKAREKLAGQAPTAEGPETARADGNEPHTLPSPRFRVSATNQIGSTGG